MWIELGILVGVAVLCSLAGFLLARVKGQQAITQSWQQQMQLERELAVQQEKLLSREQDLMDRDQRLHQQENQLDDLQDHLNIQQQQKAAAESRLQLLEQHLQAREDQLREALQGQDHSQQEARRLAVDLATLQSELTLREQHFTEQLQLLEQNKQGLKQDFAQLAQQIFEQKQQTFSEQSRQSLDALLRPFQQQMGDFRSKVENLHLEGTKQQTELRTELRQLQQMHQQMTAEANALATALKGQKKMQGNWGEMVLENVLERSGLRADVDYRREVALQDEEGNRGRPDVVVYLPQHKHLIIDAKVSLAAYTRLVNADDEPTRQLALKEHVQAMRDRIKELAERHYYRLKGMNSPDMVFMFVPIESAYVEALKADESLFQEAINQKVLVTTPTTLLTSLNIVSQLWRFEEQNRNTAALAASADKVYNKLRTFLGSFENIKKSLESAQDAYFKAESQLTKGKGNLVKVVKDFRDLAPSISAQLPEHYAELAELELEPPVEPALGLTPLTTQSDATEEEWPAC